MERKAYRQLLEEAVIPGHRSPVLPTQSQTAAFTLQNKFIKHPKQTNIRKTNAISEAHTLIASLLSFLHI